ncbi:hypothetical protein EGR_03846 [Echinococcus granulosus]|uniref:Uncharacterized protein n=1 Tax=Echinococcus granulosus TaxID=6210 RepID=W6UIP5_ECHGR|nr:hypothetical protein EGR_03846 [Echinococcus granulosus]EUB61360.1 hypothetical protein EGR_03846 [Echinococcus granulosus]
MYSFIVLNKSHSRDSTRTKPACTSYGKMLSQISYILSFLVDIRCKVKQYCFDKCSHSPQFLDQVMSKVHTLKQSTTRFYKETLVINGSVNFVTFIVTGCLSVYFTHVVMVTSIKSGILNKRVIVRFCKIYHYKASLFELSVHPFNIFPFNHSSIHLSSLYLAIHPPIPHPFFRFISIHSFIYLFFQPFIPYPAIHHPSIHSSIYPPIRPSIHLVSIHPPVHPFRILPSIHPSCVFSFIHPFTHQSIYPFIRPSIHPFFILLSIHLPTCLSTTYLFPSLPTYQSVYLPTQIPVFISAILPANSSIHLSTSLPI